MRLGERLKVSRLRLGLSLRELAGRVGVSAQAISKYERGLDVPSSAVLIRLSRALGVSIDYLLHPKMVNLSSANYRRQRSKMKPQQEDILLDEVQDWLERYLTVESLVGETTSYCLPNNDRKIGAIEEVEQVAIELRHAWDLGLNAIPNLTETLEERGIKVGFLSGVDHFDALSLLANETIPVIVVKKDLPGDRQRFNIAHELAHLVLEPPEDWNLAQIEKLANRFAGAFLAPMPTVKQELGSRRRALKLVELHLLKHKYGLSMQAWVYRALHTGVISSTYAKQLFHLFRTNGWHRIEPGDSYPPETSTRMERLIMRALQDEIIGAERASELLGKPLKEFMEEFRHQHGEIPLCD